MNQTPMKRSIKFACLLFSFIAFTSFTNQIFNDIIIFGDVQFNVPEGTEFECRNDSECKLVINNQEIWICSVEKELTACNIQAIPQKNLHRATLWLKENRDLTESKKEGSIELSPYFINYCIREQFDLYQVSYLIFDERKQDDQHFLQFSSSSSDKETALLIDQIVQSIKELK